MGTNDDSIKLQQIISLRLLWLGKFFHNWQNNTSEWLSLESTRFSIDFVVFLSIHCHRQKRTHIKFQLNKIQRLSSKYFNIFRRHKIQRSLVSFRQQQTGHWYNCMEFSLFIFFVLDNSKWNRFPVYSTLASTAKC